jgi:PAS domain-containing protein
MEVWRRRGKAASAGFSAALYSVYSGLYSEAVVSSVASALALVDVGRFREAVEYVQKAAKALYEGAREVFERVKVSLQRLVELFVETVTRVLAWIDEHKAYLFLMAAVAAGVVALNIALDMWGLVELEKLAHFAMGVPPFIPGSVKKYSREEVFNILKNAPDPYEKFKEMARDANAGKAKLPQPWESLRKLIILKRSELDEKKEKALFYAVLALEEAFGVYRSALKEVVEGLGKAVQRVEMVEEPFKKVVYMADLRLLTQLAEEESKAFENALKILRERLNEYAVKHDLKDLLDVKEDVARRLAEAKAPELSEFGDVNFGVKAYAALIAYREYALGRRGVFGTAAKHWLEVGGSAWLLYYTPSTAYEKAERAGVERPVTVEEMVAEALRRLFLKPGANHYRGLVEELTKGGKLALELEEKKTKEKTESYVFKLFRVEEGGELKELGIKLSIRKVGEGMTYTLIFGMKSWRGFFEQVLEVAMKAAGEVGGRLSVEDSLLYMLGWVDSDVAIIRKKKGNRVLRMSTSHRWQLAETHALFDWSYVAVLGVSLTLEGPKLAVTVEAPLERLDEAIKKSAEGGWLKMLGIKAESWDGLKRWVAGHWGEVIGAVKRRLEGVEVGSGFDLTRALEELERLKSRLDDDKVAREVVAPALLLMQAEKLGVNEATLKYFGAMLWGAVGGDGYVSAAEKEVNLTSGEGAVALLWAAAWSAYGARPRATGAGRVFHVVASNDDAVRLAQLCVLFGPPMLEKEGFISHKLVEAVELGSKVSVRIEEGSWRRIKGGAAMNIYISAGGVLGEFNLYLQEKVLLEFKSTDREEVELKARLLSLAGVEVRVRKEGNRDVWYIQAYTDQLAEGNEELRKGLVKAVEGALRRGLIDEEKAKRWIEKFEKGVSTWRGYKFKIGLSGGALQVKFQSTNPENIRKLKQELESLGLRECEHFTVKWSEDEKIGYIYIAREGIIELAYIAKYGADEAQRLGAASLIEHLRIKAELAGKEVLVKLEELIREGESRRSLRAEGLKTIVEIEWKGRHVEVPVEVKNIKAWEDGDKLRIVVGAIVGGVEGQWTATFRRTKKNAIEGYTVARVNAPGGREEDAKRIIALVKALTGEEPNIKLDKGKPVIIYTRRHLDGFKKYAEVADTIREWEWKSVYARRG